uniref:Uncharacterized protein n=1 Tax=Escherichia coli TaxID=562 RepID=A0A6H1Q196_ECOLX|nr:hypothetical protein [Escherichia coli]
MICVSPSFPVTAIRLSVEQGLILLMLVLFSVLFSIADPQISVCVTSAALRWISDLKKSDAFRISLSWKSGNVASVSSCAVPARITVSSRIIVRLTPSACFLLKECRKIIAYWPPLS